MSRDPAGDASVREWLPAPKPPHYRILLNETVAQSLALLDKRIHKLTLLGHLDTVPGMYRSVLTRLLLIFALLFAQMGGLAHGITHILGQSHAPDHSLAHDKYCNQCAAYGQIGSAIGSSISFASSEYFETLHFNGPASYSSVTFVAFAARASPYSA